MLLSNPGKCVTINDEAFLTSAIYFDFGCMAHELALLESSLTSELHAPQNLLRNYGCNLIRHVSWGGGWD